MNSNIKRRGDASKGEPRNAREPQEQSPRQSQHQVQHQLKQQLDLAHDEVRRLQDELEQAEVAATARSVQLLEANEQLVSSSVRAQVDVETTVRALDEASRTAGLDPLTELPNRVLMLDRLGHAIAVAKRHGGRIGLLYVDLDDFKSINDAYGHTVGDQVLRRTASLLVDAVRGADTVGRQGGDEFLVLLTEIAHPDDVVAVADKVIATLGAAQQIGAIELHLRTSVGISIFPDDGDNPSVLIERADAAMYRAKRRGTNGRALFGGVVSADAAPRAESAGSVRPPAPPVHASGAHEARHRDLREANEQLVLAVFSAQEKEASAVAVLRRHTAFLARAAHELRSPLAPIRHASAMVGMTRADSKLLARAMVIIDGQVLRIERLVADLLDVSRANTGRLRIQRRLVELGALVDDAASNWRPLLESRHQYLEVRRPATDLQINGDPARLAQVLDNVLDNASRYTPEGGAVHLRVEESGPNVVITVIDSGVGIARESLTTVFEPFDHGARVHDTHEGSTAEVGLGIGLTVVRELVEAHDGTVQILSAGRGHGTRVVVTLPLVRD